MPVRVRSVLIPMRTEIYIVASADGTPEEVRGHLADLLAALSEDVRRDKWAGGRLGRPLEGGGLAQVEADLVDPWAEPDDEIEEGTLEGVEPGEA